MRWPVIAAFYRGLSGDVPQESAGLNRAAVVEVIADLFEADARLSFERAKVYGKIVESLSSEQKQYFAKMKFGDFNSWPDVDANPYRMPRGTEKMVNVAYMTYASEFFSWYAGSVEADTYFCPERHGTYFGGFYMKDMPAMGKKDFDISTTITGDSGRDFLNLLNRDQRKLIDDIPAAQKQSMREIVSTRRAISTELRKFLIGQPVDEQRVLQLGRKYGELDGSISFDYATAFIAVGRSMTETQKAQSMKLRNLDGYTSAPAYTYSTAEKAAPDLGDTDRFFFAPRSAEPR